jgi:hypothetical protein
MVPHMPVLSLIYCLICEISCANTPVILLWYHLSVNGIIICEFTTSKLLYSFNDGVVVHIYCAASKLCNLSDGVVVGQCYCSGYLYVILQLWYSAKLLQLLQPHSRTRTYAHTCQSTQRAIQLRGVLDVCNLYQYRT